MIDNDNIWDLISLPEAWSMAHWHLQSPESDIFVLYVVAKVRSS